jgi:hypothetical protein
MHPHERKLARGHFVFTVATAASDAPPHGTAASAAASAPAAAVDNYLISFSYLEGKTSLHRHFKTELTGQLLGLDALVLVFGEAWDRSLDDRLNSIVLPSHVERIKFRSAKANTPGPKSKSKEYVTIYLSLGGPTALPQPLADLPDAKSAAAAAHSAFIRSQPFQDFQMQCTQSFTAEQIFVQHQHFVTEPDLFSCPVGQLPAEEFTAFARGNFGYDPQPLSLHSIERIAHIQQVTAILDDDILAAATSDRHCPIIPLFLLTNHFDHDEEGRAQFR